MKIAPIVLFLFVSFCSLSRGEIAPERKKQLMDRYYESGTSSFDVRKLTNEEKQFLITFIREQIVNDPSEKNNIRSTSNEALVVLGDQEVTTRFLAHFRESGLDGGTLIDSNNPKLIELLSTDLFQEDPWPPPPLRPNEDLPTLPLSYRACQVIELLLADSPSFSKEVNEWATRNFKYDPRLHFVSMPERRASLRKWWKENEHFFKSKDYKSVKPGDELLKP